MDTKWTPYGHQTYNSYMLLSRLKLQEDLYSIGTYILDNYDHFNCHVSQEYFEGNFGKHASHLRPQSYRGIYKYYFFVKYAPTLEFDNRVYDFSAPYVWQSFDNDFDWYRYVFSEEDYNTLIGLSWGAQTFLEWEKRYLEENPNFKRTKDKPLSEVLKICFQFSFKDKKNPDNLRHNVDYDIIFNTLTNFDSPLALLGDLDELGKQTEEAIKQRRAEDMQYYEKEDILKELWNKPELRDSLEFAMKYHIRRINNGLPFNALEDEMINVHLLTPLFKCKFPHNFCYVLAELVKISFERKTKPIVLDNPKALGELPKTIQPLIKELTDSLKT